MKPFVYTLIAAVVLIAAGSTYSALRGPSWIDREFNEIAASLNEPPSVTLQHVLSDSHVQMFDSLDDDPNVKITIFPNGTRCKKIGGPIPFVEAGVAMHFYELDCDGAIGYVNVQWVKD